MSAPTYRDGSGRTVELGEELGAGGEGTVYAVRGSRALCAKIYRADRAAARADKIAAMIASPPLLRDRAAITWPVDVLHGGDGRASFAGFLMPKLRGMIELHRLLVPDERMQIVGWLTQRDLHRIAAALSRLVAAVHRAGHCVGDLKPQNILVAPLSGQVALVDTDSFQVRERGGRLHRGGVITPEYGAPELAGVDLRKTDRAAESDAFALAVIVHQLLMGGSHPFDGDLAPGQTGSVERVPGRIRRGMSPLVPSVVTIRPPPGAIPSATLHSGLRDAFARCFGEGHKAPARRPSAEVWEKTLLAAAAALTRCRRSEAHFHDRSLERCPWCERRERTGIDLFPVGQRWQRRTVARAPDPAAASELDRARWLASHVRGRVAGRRITAAERAWLEKAGAALGFDRARVAETIADALAPPAPRATIRARLAGLVPSLSLPRVTLPRVTLPRLPIARIAGLVPRVLPRRRAIWLSAGSLAALAILVWAPSRLSASAPRAREPVCAVLASRAVIGNTHGMGAFLRAAPSLASHRQPLPEGTRVRLTGRTHAADRLEWAEVEAVGRTGWVAARYVVARE